MKMKTTALPPLVTKYEDSATYRSYAAPSLKALVTELRTEEQRAAMEAPRLAWQLAVLASRVNTAMRRGVPLGNGEDEQALIATLPQHLRTPLALVEAAMAAAPDDKMIRYYHFMLTNPDITLDNEVAAQARASDAFEQDPTNGAALLLFLITVFKTETTDATIESLDADHHIGGVTKTMREWLEHLVSLDEYNSTAWYLLAARLFQMSCDEHPDPTITIHNVEYDASMLAARMLQLRRLDVEAFGQDVVAVGRFVKDNVPEKPSQRRVTEAVLMLARVMSYKQTITMDRLVRHADGSIGPNGVETITPMSAFAAAASIQPRNPRTWTRLCLAASNAKMTSVTVGGASLSLPQCMANAAALAPTDPKMWANVVALLIDNAKRACPSDQQQALTIVQNAVLVVRGVELTGWMCQHLAENTPTDEANFEAFLDHVRGLAEESRAQKLAGGRGTKSLGQRIMSPMGLAGLGAVGIVCGVGAALLLRKHRA